MSIVLGGYCGKIARTFSRNSGIVVEFAGDVPHTNFKKIVLPANSEEIAKTNEGRVTIEGHLDHEWLHVYFAGEDEAKGLKTVPDYLRENKEDKRYRLITNAVDDVRIERNAPYVGVQENLRRSNENLLKKLKAKLNESISEGEPVNPVGLIVTGLIGEGMEEDCSWLPNETREALSKMSDEIEMMRGAKTSVDVHEATVAILKKLEEQEEEQEDDQSSESDEGDSEDSKSGKSESDEEQQGEGKSSGENSDNDEGDKGDGEAGGDETEECGGEGDLEDSESDDKESESSSKTIVLDPTADLPEDLLREKLEGDIKVLSKDIQADPERRKHVAPPEIEAQDSVLIPNLASFSEYNAFRDRIDVRSSTLRNRLVTALFARRACRIQGDKEAGRLENRVLPLVRFGHRSIYTERVKGDDLSTAVAMLIDYSGSMGRGAKSKIDLACQAAHQLGKAFDSLKLSFGIFAWTNIYQYGRSSKYDPYYNRFEPYRYYKVKGFRERFKKIAPRLAWISQEGGCDNDDGGALRWAASQLAKIQADRHILMVLSDGLPASDCHDYSVLVGDLHSAIEEIEGVGIEVIAIGIKSDHVRKYYRYSAVVYNLSELSAEVVNQLKAAMIDRAPQKKRARR